MIRKSIRCAATILFGFFVFNASAVQAGGGPLGYQVICLKSPSVCTGGGSGHVSLTPTHVETLKRINISVNREIRPQSDGAGDVWTVGAKTGDCEDYALTKRVRLVKAGLPPGSLRIAYVLTRSGESHAVLVIKSQLGDLVLDNLTNAIKPIQDTSLKLVKMTASDGVNWI